VPLQAVRSNSANGILSKGWVQFPPLSSNSVAPRILVIKPGSSLPNRSVRPRTPPSGSPFQPVSHPSRCSPPIARLGRGRSTLALGPTGAPTHPGPQGGGTQVHEAIKERVLCCFQPHPNQPSQLQELMAAVFRCIQQPASSSSLNVDVNLG
jgi:hypothetical protein